MFNVIIAPVCRAHHRYSLALVEYDSPVLLCADVARFRCLAVLIPYVVDSTPRGRGILIIKGTLGGRGGGSPTLHNFLYSTKISLSK